MEMLLLFTQIQLIEPWAATLQNYGRFPFDFFFWNVFVTGQQEKEDSSLTTSHFNHGLYLRD